MIHIFVNNARHKDYLIHGYDPCKKTHVHKHRKALNIERVYVQYAAGVFLNIIHTVTFTYAAKACRTYRDTYLLHWRNLAVHMYINFCIHTVGIMLYIKIHLYTH
jgi:hypothetical protein